MSTLQPITTLYRGYRFRSRLEARWSVFFQTLGVRWEYEPEGFRLSNGKYYLPDFRVSLAGGRTTLWAEIKPSDDATELFQLFASQQSDKVALLHQIPDPTDIGPRSFEGFTAWYGSGWCVHHKFCICRMCSAIGFEFDGRSDRINCACKKAGDRGKNYDDRHILKAYAAARGARFEHGEYGEVRT